MVLLQLYREHQWFLNCGKQEQVENLPLGYKSRHWQRVGVRNKNKTKFYYFLWIGYISTKASLLKEENQVCLPSNWLRFTLSERIRKENKPSVTPTHYTNTFYLEIPIVRCTNTFCSPVFQITQLQVVEKQTAVNYNYLYNKAVVKDPFVRLQHG